MNAMTTVLKLSSASSDRQPSISVKQDYIPVLAAASPNVPFDPAVRMFPGFQFPLAAPM